MIRLYCCQAHSRAVYVSLRIINNHYTSIVYVQMKFLPDMQGLRIQSWYRNKHNQPFIMIRGTRDVKTTVSTATESLSALQCLQDDAQAPILLCSHLQFPND